MSKELTEMTIISIVQQLPEEDILSVQTYIKNLKEGNEK